MAKHKHKVRRDLLHDKLGAATMLGDRKIPTAMTYPLAQIKSALRMEAETLDDARGMLRDQFTEGTRDDKGKLTPDPVYAENADGTPKFKLDGKGNPTTDREISQGKVQLTNSVLYSRELRDLDRGFCVIEVPHLSWPQLEGKVPSLEGNITEALMEFFDDLPKEEAAREPREPKEPRDATERKPAARSAAKGAATEPAPT